MADCHPDRRHYAHGLCVMCYAAARRATPENKAYQAAYQIAHDATPKRKAARAAYAKMPQYRAYQAAYKASPKGKATQTANNATPKTIASKAAHEATHPEQHRSRNHARRARQRGNGGAHTAAEFIALCWSSRWTCAYCDFGVEFPVHEHRVPLCRGGSNSIENIAVACGPCNSRKGRQTDTEFMERCA